MKQNQLKAAIDRMVEDAIRRILPDVMNEVLLRTITNGGLIREAPVPVRAEPQRPRQPQPKRASAPPVGSLRDLLDEQAGSEFYEREAPVFVPEPEPVHETAAAKRLAALPPMLRELAEDVDLDDGGGEMWGDDEFAPTSEPVSAQAPSLNIDHAARVAEVDFSRARTLIERTEGSKPKETSADRAAKVQWEMQRLERMRNSLDRKA